MSDLESHHQRGFVHYICSNIAYMEIHAPANGSTAARVVKEEVQCESTVALYNFGLFGCDEDEGVTCSARKETWPKRSPPLFTT